LVFVSYITDPYLLEQIEILKKDRDHWRNLAVDAGRVIGDLRAKLDAAMLDLEAYRRNIEVGEHTIAEGRRAQLRFKEAIEEAEEELAIYRAVLFGARVWYCPLCHGTQATGHAPDCEAALRCDPQPESPQ
jgi:hypothetical protein